MYAECLDAVKGYRSYEGQSRIVAPITEWATEPAAVEPSPVQVHKPNLSHLNR